jgi:hypothetical protein
MLGPPKGLCQREMALVRHNPLKKGSTSQDFESERPKNESSNQRCVKFTIDSAGGLLDMILLVVGKNALVRPIDTCFNWACNHPSIDSMPSVDNHYFV